MKNFLKILILTLVLSLSGCIDVNKVDSTTEIDSNNVYPNSRSCTDVPGYYYNIIGVTKEGITLKVYETGDDIGDVLKWYRDKLRGAGYEVALNTTVAKISGPYGTVEYGVVAFKRGEEAIGIWAMREDERTIYFVGRGPADKILGSTQPSESTEMEDTTPPTNNEVEKPQLPSSDRTSGEEPIERYPNSVMLEHGVVTVDGKKYIYIRYGTDRDPEEVFNWYRENIKREGWNVMYITSDGNTYTITCGKNNNNEVVAVVVERGEYTTINVEYMTTSE